MPIVDVKKPGQFCWVELATTDQSAAKKYYQSLFGWTSDDVPMGPDAFYTMFKLNGHDAAACYALRPDQLERGVPVHWSLFISTNNTDESAKRATELGANIILPPFDVMGAGRMAVMHDPTGAVFSLWQAAESTAHLVKGEEGAFCWADLLTKDREKAVAFYTALFGWTIEKEDESPAHGYYHIKSGEDYIGGMPPSESLPPGTHTHWSVYFQTSDCAAKTAQAVSLGGRAFVSNMKIEGAGTMSVVADPQYGTFCIFESSRK
ncbi:Glyoxalase/bleomycin resistance protein/dioxygenase [Candidatus Koribacter versatilis Ellin345]|uniref:Glyoxalase/bleomycin resistance protein/dioxygenase n=1 Tax=Koribacter versatilis (strain Ellin345) TaxID=204669 RepID=Q1IHZ3_KORVE|nr:VOC family protein [Candidatus Koribacter versatilis]ABF43507.1 Glyoxalase/bleomycin resistance protein/dioxygenase [Candidatus Koribacter versatilis Ellin345]